MAVIKSGHGFYKGRFFDAKKSFNLNYKGESIFEKVFDGSNTNIVSTVKNNIYIPKHFFVTGEEVTYAYSGSGTQNAIGIGTTIITGIGLTNKLPSTVYIVKFNDLYVNVAASASESLQTIPKVLDITNIGIGTLHKFTAKNQNSKVLISIDNVIQSPVVSTAITTNTVVPVLISNNNIDVIGITSFFTGDLIKIDNEIMRINSLGIGADNRFNVERSSLGTGISTHSSGALVTKIVGNYNIINNIINFAEAPYGSTSIGTTISSTFNGRVFIRSGVVDSLNESYYHNYIFDDISSEFVGLKSEFTLKSNGLNITNISASNAVILINDIFQEPSRINLSSNYSLKENSGITSISFTGFSSEFSSYDINTRNIPRGGIIVSVGSTNGFGYQPLVAAGGTATVSVAGTISAISIGNSGSGYRVGIQTYVRVGVVTSSVGIANIEFIGTASVSNGHIVGVSVTNPGVGYTRSNPPLVIFDSPLSYSNIPLIYSSSSVSGVGTEATINIVVGQGSSIINFEIKNGGYRYGQKEVLTIKTGGTIGIPTNTSLLFKEFQITVDTTFNDKFNGWTFGDLQVLDSIDSLFDGINFNFPIKINGNTTTIRSKKGSILDAQASLLIFINDILQVPGEAYTFKGGSIITFTEPPKIEDTSKLLFYKGTSNVDILEIDILETIKPGDNIILNSDDFYLQEDKRIVTEIVSSDALHTNVYPGPGITQVKDLLRPILWCRQTEDKIINEQYISKNRSLYEAFIQPVTNIIQPIGVNTTVIYVENVRTFFDSTKEFNSENNKISIVSQESLVSASATAIVSIAGTISFIKIFDGGVGYSTSPIVSIAPPVGFGIVGLRTSYIQGDPVPSGIGTQAAASSLISIGGTISFISITNPGSGYTSSNPPEVIVEFPTTKMEVISKVNYAGDFGIITGINTTSVGIASTGIVFDLFIPHNSFLRNSSIVGAAITISEIQTGYYFIVNNSNIGYGITSLDFSGGVVGIGTTFIDNIYQVSSVSIAQTMTAGAGMTYVAKVTVSVSDYNNLSGLGFSGFYGEYSWGRITNLIRKNPTSFSIYNNGISGINTSPIVQRYNPLKYQNYLI